MNIYIYIYILVHHAKFVDDFVTWVEKPQFLRNFYCTGMVLKPGPNRMVRSKISRIAHFCGSLWEKSKDLCEPRSNLTILRTVIRPLHKLKFNSKGKWQKKMHVTDKSFNKLC